MQVRDCSACFDYFSNETGLLCDILRSLRVFGDTTGFWSTVLDNPLKNSYEIELFTRLGVQVRDCSACFDYFSNETGLLCDILRSLRVFEDTTGFWSTVLDNPPKNSYEIVVIS